MDLRFTVKAPAGENETYRPMALFVKRDDGDDDGRTGWDTFESFRVDGDSITVRDNFKHPGAVYKYFVVIQRKSDRAICLIDPEIENSTND